MQLFVVHLALPTPRTHAAAGAFDQRRGHASSRRCNNRHPQREGLCRAYIGLSQHGCSVREKRGSPPGSPKRRACSPLDTSAGTGRSRSGRAPSNGGQIEFSPGGNASLSSLGRSAGLPASAGRGGPGRKHTRAGPPYSMKSRHPLGSTGPQSVPPIHLVSVAYELLRQSPVSCWAYRLSKHHKKPATAWALAGWSPG